MASLPYFVMQKFVYIANNLLNIHIFCVIIHTDGAVS